jgi:hypothetical protein
MSKLLGQEHDGLGVVTRYHKEDGKTVIETVQDVEPYLERNKAEFNSHGDWRRFGGGMTKVASIPHVVVERLMKQGLNIFNKDDLPKIYRKLNDPEYRYLRTSPGKL